MLDFKVTEKRSKILKRYGFKYRKHESSYYKEMLFSDAEILKNNGNSYSYYYWASGSDGLCKKSTDNKFVEEITWAELVKLLTKEYPNE
jgi:hypothetical protein